MIFFVFAAMIALGAPLIAQEEPTVEEFVNVALFHPGQKLIEEPCADGARYPLAQLATFLYVNARLTTGLAGGHEPIVLISGSGLGTSPVQKYLLERDTVGIRNVVAVTDLFSPDGYLFTDRDQKLPVAAQADWVDAVYDTNTPLLGTDAACSKRDPRGEVCQKVSRSFVIKRGAIKLGVLSTGDDDAGTERALYFRDRLQDVDAVVWIRHQTERTTEIPKTAFAHFDAIVTPFRETEARHPIVVFYDDDIANASTVTLRFKARDVTIVNQQRFDASDFDPMPEPSEILQEIETVFCDAWNREDAPPISRSNQAVWRHAISAFSNAELIQLPAIEKGTFPTTRLRHYELLEPIELYIGALPGADFRKLHRTFGGRAVDPRASYRIAGSRSQLESAGAGRIEPMRSPTGEHLLTQDVVWENRRVRAKNRALEFLFLAGPTFGVTQTVVPDDLNPYTHRVFDGPSSSSEPGVELAAQFYDGTATREIELRGLLQFGAFNLGTKEEPFVVPTRDRLSFDATIDYSTWRDKKPKYVIPLPRLKLGIETQLSRNDEIPGHRTEPFLEAGPVWKIGAFLEFGLAIGPRAYVQKSADFGLGYGGYYRVRPIALFYIGDQPFSVASAGRYSRLELGDDYAVEIRHRHELSQRLFDFIELYGALDWFDFGRASVGTFATHRQWLAGVRATFFLRQGTIETSYE